MFERVPLNSAGVEGGGGDPFVLEQVVVARLVKTLRFDEDNGAYSCPQGMKKSIIEADTCRSLGLNGSDIVGLDLRRLFRSMITYKNEL